MFDPQQFQQGTATKPQPFDTPAEPLNGYPTVVFGHIDPAEAKQNKASDSQILLDSAVNGPFPAVRGDMLDARHPDSIGAYHPNPFGHRHFRRPANRVPSGNQQIIGNACTSNVNKKLPNNIETINSAL
jgi:hypothetical protein